jgi:hypothetical protein
LKLLTENPSWGSDRIVGALANLHHEISDSTVDNIHKRNGIPPAPERSKNTTWRQFLKAHWEGLIATDFFTTEVLCWKGLITFYTLFVIELRSRLVQVCRHDRLTQWPMDDASGPATDRRNGWLCWWQDPPDHRPGYEVLPRLPSDPGGRRDKNRPLPTTRSQIQRHRGTIRTVHKNGVFEPVDLLGRGASPHSCVEVR